jgi:hypothetical protein
MSVIPFSRDLAFDPEHVQAMLTAFEAVRAELRLRQGDQRTELAALKLVDLAKAGERDADKLTAFTLAEFET